MKINFKTERYCSSCHKVKELKFFNKVTKQFRIASKCKQHDSKRGKN